LTLYARGTVLGGRYHIIAPIAQGAMGAVYQVADSQTRQTLALKVLLNRYLHREDLLERFRREVQALVELNHPNIVRYHDHGAGVDGAPFLVTELLDGYPAKKLVGRVPPTGLPQIVHIADQMCQALNLAHQHGIVHRDLKWSNVMITPLLQDAYRLKLLDFGVLKYSTGTSREQKRLTGSGVLIGRPEYNSPELILGLTVDGRSDLYALGVMLYELIAGRLPFKATGADLLLAHIQQPPDPFDPELGVPAAMQAVILRALAKEPEQRFGSVAFFSRALTAALREG
jgi:serine/threonine-protein kinase